MSSFRVFISSTFKNFERERNYLAQNLYTSLDNTCKSNGYAFHAIDLRWGISNEASLDNKSMLLCLEEIKKCQATNIKPNFLIMLGDYYGWKPLPFTIEKSEAELLIRDMNSDDACLFNQCYKLDTNNTPEEYVLQGRCGEFVNNEKWAKVETALHDALERSARNLLTEDKLDKYIYSATHQEIIHGFLNQEIVKDYTFVFIKEEGNIYNNDEDYKKAQALKEKVVSTLPDSQYAIYKTEDEFIDAVKKSELFLRTTIEKQVDLLGMSDKQLLFLEGLSDNYIQDKALEEHIFAEIKSYKGQKIFITSDRHEGKSSLMFNLYKQQLDIKKQKTYLWSANSDYEHLSVIDLCRYIIRKFTNGKQNPYLEYDNACYVVQKIINEDNAHKKHVFLIDGIEGLFDSDKVLEAFYNIILPNNVVFILSVSRNTKKIRNGTYFNIEPFNNEKKELLFDSILNSKNRCITTEQREVLLPLLYNSNPFVVRFLAYKMAKTHSYDEFSSSIDTFDSFIKNEISALSNPKMYGELIISRILLYLAFSPYGISEKELFDLLQRDQEVVRFLKSVANWDFDESVGVPRVIVYRIMADLVGYVSEFNDKGEIIYRLNAQFLIDLIISLYDKGTVESIYAFYKDYFRKRQVYIRSKNKKSYDKIDSRIARQWMLIASKEDSELYEGLTSRDFCDACIKLGEIGFLINGFKKLNLLETKEYKIITKHFSQLLVFNDMYLTYLVSEEDEHITDYKKFKFDNSFAKKTKITNWMNDKIEFSCWSSDNTYIITCQNALVKIDAAKMEIINKLNFNSQILKCCLSKNKRYILVICAPQSFESGTIKLYYVNLLNWEKETDVEISSVAKETYNDSGMSVYAINDEEFAVLTNQFSHSDDTWKFSSSYSIYKISKGTVTCLCKLDGLICSFVPISSNYLLIKTGLKTLRLYHIPSQKFVSNSNSFKIMKFDLNNAVVANDLNTYCFVEGVGLFRLYVENNGLKIIKVFPLLNVTKLPNSNKWYLDNCFIVKQEGFDFADIYTYQGKFLGNIEWDGSTYILDAKEEFIDFVDIGGAVFKKTINSTITYNQDKVKPSLSEFWSAGGKSLGRFFNIFKSFHQTENQKNICRVSPNGQYIAKLTNNGLVIKRGEKLIFHYTYISKHSASRNIGFVSNDLLVWKLSYKKVKLINFEKRTIKTIYKSRRKLLDYLQIDDSIYLSNFNSITKLCFSDDGIVMVNKSAIDYSAEQPVDLVKQLRKEKKAKILFSYVVPSQLSYVDLENNKIIYVSDTYAIKYYNNKLFFYKYNSDDSLIKSFISEQFLSMNGTKMVLFNNSYYIYLQKFNLVIVYNSIANQKMQYMLDDSVTDVQFDKNTIRLLHNNGEVEKIEVL